MRRDNCVIPAELYETECYLYYYQAENERCECGVEMQTKVCYKGIHVTKSL